MSKRLLSLLLAVVLLWAVCLPALAAGSMQQGSMYVNTANGRALRFRSSRSTSADNILAEIPYGTKVYVTSWDGTWARIKYNSAIGYVVKKHLSIARPEPYEQVEQERAAEAMVKELEKEVKTANKKLDHSRVKNVTPYDVTVRSGVSELAIALYRKPDLTSDVLTSYEEGTRLEVTAQNKDWALVYHGGTERTGYMLLEDLEPDIVEEEVLEDDELPADESGDTGEWTSPEEGIEDGSGDEKALEEANAAEPADEISLEEE